MNAISLDQLRFAKPHIRPLLLTILGLILFAFCTFVYVSFRSGGHEVKTDDLFSDEARHEFLSKLATPKLPEGTRDTSSTLYETIFYERQLARALHRSGRKNVRLSDLSPQELAAIKKVIENVHAKDKVNADTLLDGSATISVRKEPSGAFTLDCRLSSGNSYVLTVPDE